jgi:putative IMPACT (imprinted ancient) family translation regulator
MLEVLRRQDLDGVLATVVRYFGGVKLGAGGLVRAYTDAVAQALLGAQKIPRRAWITLRCSVPYALEGVVRRELQQSGAQLRDVAHGDAVTFDFAVVDVDAPALVSRLNEAGQGALLWSDEAGAPRS